MQPKNTFCSTAMPDITARLAAVSASGYVSRSRTTEDAYRHITHCISFRMKYYNIKGRE